MPADEKSFVCAAARDYPDGAIVGEHCHAEGQFIHATAGVMEIRAMRRTWLVPPQRALWIPPRMPHFLRARNAVSLRTLYVAGADADRFGNEPIGFRISQLVRELILRTLDRRVALDLARSKRVTAVILDELNDLAPDTFSLVMPADARLKRVCEIIVAAPERNDSIDALARDAGASVRSLARLARADLGCSLSFWRQQARVMAAIPMLIDGLPVTKIAHDLGYETSGAFAAMFKRFVGVTPRSYRSQSQV